MSSERSKRQHLKVGPATDLIGKIKGQTFIASVLPKAITDAVASVRIIFPDDDGTRIVQAQVRERKLEIREDKGIVPTSVRVFTPEGQVPDDVLRQVQTWVFALLDSPGTSAPRISTAHKKSPHL